MRLYCTHCGNYFGSDELHYRRECVGEFWGTPAYDDFPECPYCGSEEFVDEYDEDFPKDEEEDE